MLYELSVIVKDRFVGDVHDRLDQVNSCAQSQTIRQGMIPAAQS